MFASANLELKGEFFGSGSAGESPVNPPYCASIKATCATEGPVSIRIYLGRGRQTVGSHKRPNKQKNKTRKQTKQQKK